MIKKIVMFIMGILISGYSLMFYIIYLNLLKMDFSFIDYIKYIFSRVECLSLFLGIILIVLSLRREKNELRLQCKNEFKE